MYGVWKKKNTGTYNILSRKTKFYVSLTLWTLTKINIDTLRVSNFISVGFHLPGVYRGVVALIVNCWIFNQTIYTKKKNTEVLEPLLPSQDVSLVICAPIILREHLLSRHSYLKSRWAKYGCVWFFKLTPWIIYTYLCKV